MLGFAVYSPKTPEAAVKLWNEMSQPAYYLSGGTDLIPKAKDGIIQPGSLIDLSGINQLKTIEERQDIIFIGALATHFQIHDSELVNRYGRVLALASGEVGSPQIRNLGTIGGNCANASPAGDTIPALYALDAEIHLMTPTQSRSIEIVKFFTGPGKTILEPGEIITGFSFKKIDSLVGSFHKLGQRKSLAISKISLAFCAVYQDGIFSRVRIALGAVAPTVIRAKEAENLIEKQPLTPNMLNLVKEKLVSACCPIDDIRSQAEYRKKMAEVLLEKSLRQAVQV